MSARCERCHRVMVPRRTWERMNDDQKAAERNRGRIMAGAKGMCKPCHWQTGIEARRAGNPRPGYREPDVAHIQARIEDAEWMAETGETLEGAAKRLGLLPSSLADFLRTNGREDITERLRARQAVSA